MDRSIVFFDDICVLCSKSVQLIIRNDPHEKFQFSAIGSTYYQQMISRQNIAEQSLPDSIILYHNEKIYTRSAAALRIVSNLRFPWPILAVFFIIPRFIRNPIYDLIASKRYQWFGKRKSCYMPAGAMKKRFR